MTTTLRTQRMLREPLIVPGETLPCVDRDGRPAELVVTLAQPRQGSGRWVNGLVNGEACAVWVCW